MTVMFDLFHVRRTERGGTMNIAVKHIPVPALS